MCCQGVVRGVGEGAGQGGMGDLLCSLGGEGSTWMQVMPGGNAVGTVDVDLVSVRGGRLVQVDVGCALSVGEVDVVVEKG